MAQVTTVKTKSQQKTGFILCIVLAVLVAAFAAGYIILEGSYMFLGKTKNMNEILADGAPLEKGDYVTLDVRFVLGNFAETKHKINGFIPIGTDQHYLIILDNGSAMPLMIKSKSDIEKLDALINPTWSFLSGETTTPPTETLRLSGCISSMNHEIEDYYKQALSTAGLDSTNTTNIYYLTFDATQTRFSKILILLMIVGLFILLIIGAIFSRKRLKQLSNLQNIARENASDPALNPFLNPSAAQSNPYLQPGASPNPAMNTEIPQAPAMNAEIPQATVMNPEFSQATAMNPEYPTAPAMNAETPQAPTMSSEIPQAPAMNSEIPQAPAMNPEVPTQTAPTDLPDSYPDTSIDSYFDSPYGNTSGSGSDR